MNQVQKQAVIPYKMQVINLSQNEQYYEPGYGINMMHPLRRTLVRPEYDGANTN